MVRRLILPVLQLPLFVVLLGLSASLAPVAGEEARGRVYEDLDGDGRPGAGEPGVARVAVSNGRDVVLTDEAGAYRISVQEGGILFVTKPSGYAVPLDDSNLPRFHYIHDPDGSPRQVPLRYRGIAPTGPLPESVDFALRKVPENAQFRVIWFADTQPFSSVEVGFVRDEVAAELVGTDAAFGITTGDIMYDDLSLWPRQNEILGKIGNPWYNVPGNHDLNLLAPDDELSLETFKRLFGPPYYSFDHGQAHFVVLDTVVYRGRGEGRKDPHPREAGTYEGRLSEDQLTWLANDLRHVPADDLVVLAMHIPLTSYDGAETRWGSVSNRRELYRILGTREHVMAVAGHLHMIEHHYLGEEDGFQGPEPMHLHTISTVSGSWWGGPPDERGIPTSVQRDGTPNGYHVMTVDGNRATMRFVPATKPADYRIRISLDASFHSYREEIFWRYRAGELLTGPISVDQVASAEIAINLFDGGPRSRVSLVIDGERELLLRRTYRPDSFVLEMFARHRETFKSSVEPRPSSHLWIGRLPGDLGPGVHTLAATAIDEYGQVHTAHRLLEVRGR